MGCGTSTDREIFEKVDVNNAGRDDIMRRISVKNIPTVMPLQVEETTLTDYLQIERDIAEAEIRNPVQPLDLKTEQLHQIVEQIDDLEGKVKQLAEQTLKEKADVDKLKTKKSSHGGDIKSTIMKLGKNFDEAMAKEMEEYIAALNLQEIATKELNTAKAQKKKVEIEVEELEFQAKKLQNLYKKQDKLLASIFGGEYGSLKENQLEHELDQLETHRGRILEANFKWRQGLMMLEYATKQLAVAVQKWQDLPAIPALEVEIRYSVSAETRNNIVAASQNIKGAQRYLDNVEFPYCNRDEVKLLDKAAEYIFTDMQSPDRHEHADIFYSTTHKRANALLQWFDTVVNTTIMKDLVDINEKVKVKTLELRRERVRMIKKKIEELYGKEIHLDQTLRGRDITADELAHAMMTDNQVVKLGGNELDNISGVDTPPLLAEDDLAPVPSNSVIFGSMYDNYNNQLEALAQQHQDDLTQFIKEQQSNQDKVQGHLQTKLFERRQRRARVKVENAQKKGL